MAGQGSQRGSKRPRQKHYKASCDLVLEVPECYFSKSLSSAQIQGVRNKTPLQWEPQQGVVSVPESSPCLRGLTVGEPHLRQRPTEPSGPGPAHLQGPLLPLHSLWVPAMSDSVLFSNTPCSVLLLCLYFLYYTYICYKTVYNRYPSSSLPRIPLSVILLSWQVNLPGLHILHSSKGTGLSSNSCLRCDRHLCACQEVPWRDIFSLRLYCLVC